MSLTAPCPQGGQGEKSNDTTSQSYAKMLENGKNTVELL